MACNQKTKSCDTDGYETITDYSLLEQVRDAIEDTELTAQNKPSDTLNVVDMSNDISFENIINKMGAKSQHTKNRINDAMNEIKAHQNFYTQKHPKHKSNLVPITEFDKIESENVDPLNQTENISEYNELILFFHEKMKALLTINDKMKTKRELFNECSNEKCEIYANETNTSFIDICPSVRRIELILNTFQRLKDNPKLWKKVSISSIFCYNVYEFQQLVDDFLHIRLIHLDNNESNTIAICKIFEDKYSCDLQKCNVFARHYRDRTAVKKARSLYYHNEMIKENDLDNNNNDDVTVDEYGINKVNDIRNDKDIIHQQELDKIHSYFLHSTLKFGKGKWFGHNDPQFSQRRNDINNAAKGRSFSTKTAMNDDPQIMDHDIIAHVNNNDDINLLKPKPQIVKYQTNIDIHKTTKLKQTGLNEISEIVQKGRKYAHHNYSSVSFCEFPSNVEFALEFKSLKDKIYSRSYQLLPSIKDDAEFPETVQNIDSLNDDNDNDNDNGNADDDEESINFSQQSDDDEFENDKKYDGVTEDEEWIKKIEKCDSEEEIYNKLVQFCGIFRWQNAHGFRSRHYQGLQHIKPRYKNIKEEVLNNDYHSITTENWNQTLRKAKAFNQSWAAAKIRSLYDGHFEDQITKCSFEWKQNERIQLKEILTLKLYTDFDRLQFELKKCFRWEYTQEVVEKNNPTPNDDDDGDENKDDKKYDEEEEDIQTKRGTMQRKNIDDKLKYELQDRLQQFYHWRQSLVMVLNKYGHKIRSCDNNDMLYHGVNAKMILDPATTPAFYGPLSTSSSFHVAKTFATDKGMVLTISSQYPRLGVCRAFYASLISDYPEEQEWLIGFIYTRIRKVHTKEAFEWKRLPPASNLRFVFFALHLFRQQIFSMSDDLEEILIEIFLKHDSATNRKYNSYLNKKNNDQLVNKNEIEMYRKAKILKILQNKYDEFRKTPNIKQIVRLDDISRQLRKYFVDETSIDIIDINKQICGDIDKDDNQHDTTTSNGGQITILNSVTTDLTNFDSDIDGDCDNDSDIEFQPKKIQYSVSFEKIKYIFYNLKEIHFYNYYKCDNIALKKLCEFIDKDANKGLQQIKFLYYDYVDNDIRNNSYFFDPKNWDEKYVNLLEAYGYRIIHKHIMHYGYKIRIYKK